MCDQHLHEAISPEQKARYLDSDDPCCPFCGSDQIEYVDYPEITRDSGLVREKCLACKRRWALGLRVIDLVCDQPPEAPVPADASPPVEHRIISVSERHAIMLDEYEISYLIALLTDDRPHLEAGGGGTYDAEELEKVKRVNADVIDRLEEYM